MSLPLLCVGATVLPTSWVVALLSFCFCFFVCFESEVWWLKKKQATVTSASPTNCVVPYKIPGGRNPSASKDSLLTQTQGKEKRQGSASAPPSHLSENFTNTTNKRHTIEQAPHSKEREATASHLLLKFQQLAPKSLTALLSLLSQPFQGERGFRTL